MDPEKLTAKRVGMVLRKLRIAHSPRMFDRPRAWRVRPKELLRLLQSYGLPIPSLLSMTGSLEELEQSETKPPEPSNDPEYLLKTFGPNTFLPVNNDLLDLYIKEEELIEGEEEEDNLWEDEL